MAATTLLASLPLQLVCQLIVPQAPGFNGTNFVVNQPPSQNQHTNLQDAGVGSGAKSILLASMSLQVVCQILVTSNPVINDTGDLVDVTTTAPTPPVTLPEGYVRFPEDHAAYKIHTDGKSWSEARDRCISEGGHLAITDTREKIANINSLKTSKNKWLHVGIYKSTTSNEWVRVDNGQPPSSVPWIENNPDGIGNCAGISVSETGLVDYQCDRTGEDYVCEIPIHE